jgi:hypothetical protein
MALNRPIVGMAATPSGRGYWLVASDGGIFAFGDAGFFGSPAGSTTATIIGIAPTSRRDGYWLVGTNGIVYNFGAAPDLGGLSGTANQPIVGIAVG